MKNQNKILIVVGALVVIIASYSIGSATTKTKLNDKVVSYKQIETEIQNKKDELTSVNNKLTAANKDFSSIQTQYNEAKTIVANKEKMEQEILSAKTANDLLKKELDHLNNQVNGKKQEFEKLSNAVVAKAQAPKIFPAGQFTAGHDIDTGRYKVTVASGRGSNFVVYDSTGGLKVNTVFGNGFGVDEYVVELADGDIIKQESRNKYTPIQ